MLNFVGGTANVTPLGTATNVVRFGTAGGSFNDGGLTAAAGTAGTFTANGFQYYGTGNGGTVANIVPFAVSNGGNTANLLTYTGATGVAAFTNYFVQTFAATGTMTATGATDLVQVVATGGAATVVTANAGQQVGAVVLTNNTSGAGFQVNLNPAAGSSFTANAGQYLITGTTVVGANNTVLGGAAGTSFTVAAAGAITNFSGETFLFGEKGGNTNRIDGVLSGAGTVVAGGTGSMNFAQASAAATYTGGTFISMASSGVQFLLNGGTSNLGTGAVTINAGRMNNNVATAAVVSNAVTFNGYVELATNQNGASLSFTGPITLAGNVVLSATQTATTTAGIALNGSIGGSGSLTVIVQSTGTATPLAINNANTFGGGFNLLGGTVTVGNNAAAGTGTLTLAGGTFQASVSVVLNNAVTLSNAGVVISSVAAQGQNITFTGPQSLTFTGTQTVSLPNANALAGGVTLNMGAATGEGTLVLGTAGSVGSGTLTLTAGVLLNGVAGGTTLGNAVSLNGSAAPVVFAGTPLTFTGTVTPSSNPLLLLANTTTFAGTVNGNVAVTRSATPVVASQPNGTTVTYLPTGSPTLTGTNTSTTSITVTGGTLALAGAGALGAITALTVNTGGTLTLDNTGTNVTNRVNDASSVALNGGTLNFLGSAAAASGETVAGLTLGAGGSTISSAPGTGQTNTLTFASLTRNAGGAVAFTGTGLGTTANQVLFTAAPTPTNGILPFATAGNNFAAYGANGIAANATFQTTLTGATSTTHVVLTDPGTISLAGATNVNSLVILTTGGTPTVINQAGFALNVTSGGLMVAGTQGATLSGGTVALAAAEGELFTGAGLTTTVNSTITGTGGLTLAGPGTVALPNANALPGPATLAGGTVIVGSNTALGTGALSLIGGTVRASSAVTLGNAITFNNSTVSFAGTNAIGFSGTTTPSGLNNTLAVANTGGTALGGQVIGSANLTAAGGGTLYLLAANTYTGNTTVAGGTLTLSGAGTALGTSAVNLFAGTTVSIDNHGNGSTTAVNVADRVANAAPWTFNGGTLTYLATAGVNTAAIAAAETIGAITLASGQATINTGWAAAPAAGSTSILTVASLTRSAGASLVVNGANGAINTTTNQLVVQALPSLTGSGANAILPYAIVADAGGTDFLTTTGTAPNVNLIHFANYSTGGINTAAGGSVYRMTTNETLTTNTSLNALLITGTGLTLAGGTLLSDASSRTLANAVTVSGNTTIAASSVGGASASGSSLTLTGTLTTAAVGGANTLTVNGTATATGGLSGALPLTVAGFGTLNLPTASPTFGAGVNLNTGASLGFMGTVVVGDPLALGTGPLTLTSGNLQTSVAGGVTLANQRGVGRVARRAHGEHRQLDGERDERHRSERGPDVRQPGPQRRRHGELHRRGRPDARHRRDADPVHG